jgi:hypothetical protein
MDSPLVRLGDENTTFLDGIRNSDHYDDGNHRGGTERFIEDGKVRNNTQVNRTGFLIISHLLEECLEHVP